MPLALRSQLLDLMQQLARSRYRVGIHVRPADHAFAIDDKHRPLRTTALIVEHIERLRNLTVGPKIRSNRKRHLTLFAAIVITHARNPRLLNRQSVAADLDDLGVQSLELIVICAEPAHLVQSATGEAGRMKADNNRLASKIGKLNFAQMRLNGEIRGLSARLKCHAWFLLRVAPLRFYLDREVLRFAILLPIPVPDTHRILA